MLKSNWIMRPQVGKGENKKPVSCHQLVMFLQKLKLLSPSQFLAICFTKLIWPESALVLLHLHAVAGQCEPCSPRAKVDVFPNVKPSSWNVAKQKSSIRAVPTDSNLATKQLG